MMRNGTPVLALVCGCALASSGAQAQPSEKVLYAFQGNADGRYPFGNLVDVGGKLYGTTEQGGAANDGTVFSINPLTGGRQLVHDFRGQSDGAYPENGLIVVGGTLYGTTAGGGGAGCGGSGCGTVFSLDPVTGIEHVLYAFRGGSDGAGPAAGLLNAGKRLYGTTAQGGSDTCDRGCGTVFSINPTTGAERILHAFQGGNDGFFPAAGVIHIGTTLYGTTAYGGVSGDGTVFAITMFAMATHSETVLHAFKGGSDGANPVSGLTAAAGMLYGTTYYGGSTTCGNGAGCGVVFTLDAATGAEKIVYVFHGTGDGAYPQATLVGMGGQLYGTTYAGPATGEDGTVYAVNPKSGAVELLYAFGGGTDGASPAGGLIAIGGTLYGTTSLGGGSPACAGGCGTVFSLTP